MPALPASRSGGMIAKQSNSKFSNTKPVWNLEFLIWDLFRI